MNYSVICFDADGVVIRSPRLFSQQLEIDYGISAAKLTPFFEGAFRECSVGKADLKDELAKVIGEWGWPGTVDELLEYWCAEGTVFDKEVLSYIEELRQQGVRCYMTTDNEKYRVAYLQKMLGDGHPFERIFYSAEIGSSKKEPGFFAYVYQALEPIYKNQVLVIDDSEKNIEVAKDFGFDGRFYTGLEDLKSKLTL